MCGNFLRNTLALIFVFSFLALPYVQAESFNQEKSEAQEHLRNKSGEGSSGGSTGSTDRALKRHNQERFFKSRGEKDAGKITDIWKDGERYRIKTLKNGEHSITRDGKGIGDQGNGRSHEDVVRDYEKGADKVKRYSIP